MIIFHHGVKTKNFRLDFCSFLFLYWEFSVLKHFVFACCFQVDLARFNNRYEQYLIQSFMYEWCRFVCFTFPLDRVMAFFKGNQNKKYRKINNNLDFYVPPIVVIAEPHMNEKHVNKLNLWHLPLIWPVAEYLSLFLLFVFGNPCW